MPRDNNKENGRKRRFSDVLEEIYRGPKHFMEAGVRGFLVTTIPDREEHAIDETVKVLRKTCVKLYGGIKPLKREDASFAKGYVMIDFMDPEQVVLLPHPDADKVAEEDKAKAAEEEEKDKAAEEATKAEGKDSEAMEEENKQGQEAAQEGGDAKAEEEEGKELTEEEKEAKAKEEKEKEEKKKKEEAKKKVDDRKPLMLAPHKFKAFRTELRNIMFIKSDIPDPVEVATACMDLMHQRKPLYTDCINQLLPVQGVCDNDYKQLEIMCRRVLVPYVGEQLEEPPSFGVLLVNKMCEPGAEVLLEVVRSAVWSLNPCAHQCSAFAEPDVVIHVELIGSKIILSAMPHYMKYRQYSPFAVHELGSGKAQDEEQLLKEKHEEHKREYRGTRGGRRKDKTLRDKKKKEQQGGGGEKKEGGEGEEEKEGKEGDEAAAEGAEGEEGDQMEGGKEEEEEQQTPEPAAAAPAAEEKKEASEKKSSRSKSSAKSKS